MKKTELTKKIIATALSLIMVIGLFPFTVFAAESGAAVESNLGDFFDPTKKGDVPDQFNTAGDPYGKNGAFNLAPQNELLKIFTGGNRDTGSTTNDAYITEGFQIGSTKVDDYSDAGTVIRHTDNPVEKYSYMQAVAFDPDGIGRDTHVAYVGYNASKGTIRMGVYDAVNGKTADNTRWVADASWISEADGVSLMQFNAYNFMSITAGDYDGNGKETVVVFGSGDGTSATLTEFYYSSSGNYIYKQDSSNSLLHKYYIQSGKGDTTNAGEKLGCDLTTGDFDGDGIDDLAVVSYVGLEGYYEDSDKLEHIAPYLAVALGCGTGEHIVTQTSHNLTPKNADHAAFEMASNNDGSFKHIGFPASPSVAAGNIDGDPEDELVIAGYAYQIKDEDALKTLKGAGGNLDGVNILSYNISDTAITRFSSYTNNINEWTEDNRVEIGTWYAANRYLQEELYKKSYYFSCPQLGVDFVKTNGASAPEELFVNGSFLKYSSQKNAWTDQYTTDYFTKEVKGVGDWKAQMGFITNTSVGVFTDNLLGREQIAYTVYIKDGDSENLIGTKDNADDYSVFAGISGGRYYEDSGTSYGTVTMYGTSGLRNSNSGYVSNSKQEFHDEQFDCGDGKNLLFVAVDVDKDGVLAQYADKDYAYSDPTVITVLQASPYYDALGYLDKCETSYTFETSFIVGQTTSNSTSFSVGANVEAESPVVKSSISSGYSDAWEESFTSQFETTYSTTFTATKDNVVVLQRTPVILYKYLVQKSDGTWSDTADEDGNYIIISVPAEPVYALVTIDEYNAFVNSEAYKNSIQKHRLSPITMDELLGNAGDPTDYFSEWPGGAVNLSANTYTATANSGSITSAYSTSAGETYEQATTQGFYFESSVSAGFSAFGSGVFAGIEYSTEGSTTQGSFTTTVDTTTVSGTVGNLGESGLPAAMLGNYVFDWQFGSWKLNLGSNANIFAYGYRVFNAKSIAQITDLKVSDGNGDAEEAVLTWGAIDGATGYTVYAYEDGDYKQIATTADNTYTYTLPTDSRQYEFTFAVTYTKDGSDSIYSDLVTYYRQSYGMSAYEIALQEGFEGTVAQWLESLIGKDGEDGIGVENFTYNNADELLAHLTDGTIINLGVINGEDGENGLTPYIDENGNWWIGETDTGVKASGADGKDGIDGITPQLRINTETNEWEVSLDNGTTWTSTGVVATGEKGDKGDQGEQGEQGEKGEQGDKGDKGDAGVGIQSAALDQEGNLIITLTDDTVLNLGKIIGADGVDGKDGANGKDGVDGQNGTNGKDGIGVADIKIDENGDLIFTMSDGSTVNAGAILKDNTVQTGGDGSEGVTQEDVETVKTLATVATVLSSVSLLWNLIGLIALIGRKKKTVAS